MADRSPECSWTLCFAIHCLLRSDGRLLCSFRHFIRVDYWEVAIAGKLLGEDCGRRLRVSISLRRQNRSTRFLRQSPPKVECENSWVSKADGKRPYYLTGRTISHGGYSPQKYVSSNPIFATTCDDVRAVVMAWSSFSLLLSFFWLSLNLHR